MSTDQFVGAYGSAWTPGILSEHVDAYVAAGGVVRPAASGSGVLWAILPDGFALPVVCSEIIRVDTEDGSVSGRCGIPATREGSCEGHTRDREDWRAMTEAERAAWERGL